MSKAVRAVAKPFFGGGRGGSPGILGTGRARISEIDISKKPFQRKVAEDEAAKQARERQERLSAQLEERAEGKDSVAAKRIQREQQRAQASRKAEAAGRRGRSGALAQRTAARQTAQAQQAFATEAGIAAAQERLSAQQALAQQIAQQRAQDIAVAESDRAAEQALEQLRVQQRIGSFAPSVSAFEGAAKRRGDLISGIGGGLAAVSDENQKKDKKESGGKAKEFLRKLKEGTERQAKASQEFGIKEDDSGQKKTGKLVGGALRKAFSGGGSKNAAAAKAFSDESVKVQLSSGKNSSKDFLDKLESFTFRYKNPERHGEGEQFGIMAQDLEAAGSVGRQMVEETEEGKQVNFGKGFGAILAAQVELNKRLEELEKRKKKRS